MAFLPPNQQPKFVTQFQIHVISAHFSTTIVWNNTNLSLYFNCSSVSDNILKHFQTDKFFVQVFSIF